LVKTVKGIYSFSDSIGMVLLARELRVSEFGETEKIWVN
jgi:hypothetical protein